MTRFVAIPFFTLAFVFFAGVPAYGAEDPPAWAYPLNPAFKPQPDDGVVRRVPGSTVTYPLAQLRDRFVAPVWHADDHPPLPSIVAQGRKPGVYACGFCHRADGPGGPENSSLAGLPAAYLIQQMADYKSGARKTSVPKRNIDLMIALSKDITAEEVEAAAKYFSALRPRANMKVVETDTVPATIVAGTFFIAAKTGDRESLGQRIVEMPEDTERFEHRDPRVMFVAYVPAGSLAKGAALVNTGGGGKTQQCAICHGQDLKGIGAVPSIAGRSPSYIVRQLYDMQSGARAGVTTQQMTEAVAKLTNDDMLSIAAYLATRAP